MAKIRKFSREQIYRSQVTQDARKGFRTAMFNALEILVTELLTWLDRGPLVAPMSRAR